VLVRKGFPSSILFLTLVRFVFVPYSLSAGVSWPEVLKHFRDSAAASSNSMRRRVDPSVFDSIKRPAPRVPVSHKVLEISEVVAKSTVLSSKVPPSKSARVAPFMPANLIDTPLGQLRQQPIPEENSESGDQQKNSTNPPSTNAGVTHELLNLSPPQSERERASHAWMTTPDVAEPPSIHAVHPLTRPFTSIAQGRKPTLEALPVTPSSKTKIGAKVAAFDRLDSLDPSETQTSGLGHGPQQNEEARTASSKGTHHSPEPLSAPRSDMEERYAPSSTETKPLPASTPETLQRHHDKSLALQQLAEQMAEQHAEEIPLEGRVSLAGATNESQLHDMIVKIRDSPHEQPKRNLQSERVMLRGTYLFHPQEPAIVLWQFFVGLGIIYSIIVVPFRLGYDVDAARGWYVFEMIIDGFFFFDILLNFRTAYFDDERKLIYDPRVLFWRYAKGWFLLDLISTVPIDELFQAVVGTSSNTLHLFPTKLLRLFRVARLLKLTRLIKLSRVFGRIRDTVQVRIFAIE